MSAFSIVESFNKIEELGSRFISGLKASPVYTLRFQRREEALARCIVVAVSSAAHAANNARGLESVLKTLACVLAPTV